MTQGTPNTGNEGGGEAVALQGGAAILAPITAFPNGVPGNAASEGGAPPVAAMICARGTSIGL